MSTTRHLLNRHRRRPTRPSPEVADPTAAAPDRETPPDAPGGVAVAGPVPGAEEPGAPVREPEPEAPRGRWRGLIALGLVTAVLGGFAGYAGERADGLREEPATRNTALADVARTSELKGRITRAVEAVFSYDFTEPERLDRAVRDHLTGRAVGRHRALLAGVRAQGPRQKLVLTTTVTHSGVERVDGDRARVLVFADQTSTSATGTSPESKGKSKAGSRTTSAAAMLALDAVHGDGGWRISGIDTFGG
ncbi:hypothetical protein ABT354_10650 [Streptomyces sp. NPDC000594]|uniref:hypothetical protein n=1 Tax=Streptomyces sp. NPDC000594 TaxID=3154261 RepID=UPI0033297599